MTRTTTCTCEGDVEWNEGTPHWTRLTADDCPSTEHVDVTTRCGERATLHHRHKGDRQ